MNIRLIPCRYQRRLVISLIFICFFLPIAVACFLVGNHWYPISSAQHGELLDPVHPINLHFNIPDTYKSPILEKYQRHWTIAYISSSSANCDIRCRTSLYNMSQVRLALGKDMDRVEALFLLDNFPDSGMHQWLITEYPRITIGIADTTSKSSLLAAFAQPGQTGDWLYLLDPLSNLLMRYPVNTEPNGLLKDLQHLLKWSKIG